MIRTVLKTLLPILVVVGSLAGAYTVVANAPKVEPRPPDRKVPVVQIVPVEVARARMTIEAHGTVRPVERLTLVPQVQGIVTEVSETLVTGGFVEEDEVLVRIDRRDYELAVTHASAGIAQAEASLERQKAEAEVARKEWTEFGRGRPTRLALKEPQLLEAEAALDSAQARLDKAKLDLSRTEIRAPFAGRVRSESVDVGQLLLPGAPIAEIYGTDSAEVRLAIPDDRLAFLDLPLGPPGEGPGRPVTLRAVFGGREHVFEGEIVRTEAELDPRTRVVYALVRVQAPYAVRDDGAPPLLVGMYVRAEIPGREVEGVTLPRAALRGRDEVLVVDDEDRLRVRKVTVLTKSDESILVSGGLDRGERVCVSPVDPVIEGMTVRVVPEGTER